MKITLRYDGYNRQFKLMDQRASRDLEDGRTYVLTMNRELNSDIDPGKSRRDSTMLTRIAFRNVLQHIRQYLAAHGSGVNA